MNPKAFLALQIKKMKAMKEVKAKSVDVGVIASEATGRVYGNGVTVLQIAAIHEFGLGSPERSFIRMPFSLKSREINKFIKLRLSKVLDTKESADKALGLIGVFAANISREAFETNGYGQWADIDQATKNAKGSDQILTDKGILKNSITHEVK